VLGLACLSMDAEGRGEIAEIVGMPHPPKGWLNRIAILDMLREVLEQQGAQAMLGASQNLSRRGFAAARRLGLSLNPFLGDTLNVPAPPDSGDAEQWAAYADEVEGWLRTHIDFAGDDFGPAFLLTESGARASWVQLRQYVRGAGVVRDADGNLVPIAHGWTEGLTPHEVISRVAGARRGLEQTFEEYADIERGIAERNAPTGFGVLARARRSRRPGVVFARAAAGGQPDPLTDAYSRLFVGLPVV